MGRIAFVIWTLLFPVMDIFCQWINYKIYKKTEEERYSKNAQAFGSFIKLVIWGYVAWLLY